MSRSAFTPLAALLTCAIACTPTTGETPGVEAGPAPAHSVEAPQADAPQPRTTAPMPTLADEWRAPDYWQWDVGEGWGESLANKTEVQTSKAIYRVGHFAKEGTSDHDGPFGVRATSLDGKELWRASLGDVFVGEGTLAFDGAVLYATHHSGIASGASVSAVDVEDGSVKWTVPLEGLGPVSHSKYRNETQIEVDERGVVVYGKESQGAYTEILDPKTGAQRRLTFPDAQLTRLAWTGKGKDAGFDFAPGSSELTSGPQTYKASSDRDERSLTVEKFEAGLADPAWSKTFESHGCGNSALWTTAGETLWVADYCGISSGVQLHMLDAASGELQRSSHPRGVGLVAHSEYFNETTLTEMLGYVVVHGREAAGNYLEVVDPKTGLSLVNLTFRGD